MKYSFQNKKADVKLGKVADAFSEALPVKCSISDNEFLQRRITLEDSSPLDSIDLKYDVENRFFASSYNLILQSQREAEEKADYHFELKYHGVMSIKNAEFVHKQKASGKSELSKKAAVSADVGINERREALLKVLNEDIIIKKIMELNIPEINISYSKIKSNWDVEIKSMIGSTTWILIPPVTHTIMPDNHEAVKMTELMMMLNAALK